MKPIIGPKTLSLLAVGMVAVGGACASDTDDSSQTAAGRRATAGDRIAVKDFAFEPTPLTAKVGSTITVTNEDGTAHTLTADDRSLDTGEIAGNASKSVTLTRAGTVAYHCNLHNYMKGVIQVDG